MVHLNEVPQDEVPLEEVPPDMVLLEEVVHPDEVPPQKEDEVPRCTWTWCLRT